MKNILLISSDDLFASFLGAYLTKSWPQLKVKRPNPNNTESFDLLIIDYSIADPNDLSKIKTDIDADEKFVIGLIEGSAPKVAHKNIEWVQKDKDVLANLINVIQSSFFPVWEQTINDENTGENQLIYYADDSKLVRNTLANFLNEKNYQTRGFENGAELLESMKNGCTPDLILLDNMMPVMTGIQTLQQLKINPNWRDIPVIFISGVTEKDIIVKALENGAADYITKPFYRNELFARVQVHLKLDMMKRQLVEKNNTITIKNDEISIQLEEISKQAALLQESNRIIAEKNQKITSSIEYAKRIQNAILPQVNGLEAVFPEHFVFFNPLDIVSGDFYWFKQLGHYMVFTVADCTGHGVPGAFMSMLGMAFLNEISRGFDKHIQANELLNELRRDIKTALRQTSQSDNKDGMDMAICVYNTETKEMQYAGAYNPLLLIRNGEIIECKADRMPVGFHPVEKESFTNHVIKLQTGDNIYMFSDGFQDQTGGEQGRKYLSRNFKNLLLEISPQTMAMQQLLLSQTLQEWKGTEHHQIDDITVMGIRIA